MSFDFKGPSFKPIIQGAQQMLNNGGGGNLGYFKRGNKEEESTDSSPKGDLFEGKEQDSFEHELDIDGENNLWDTIKNWFNKMLNQLKEFFKPKSNPFSNQ